MHPADNSVSLNLQADPITAPKALKLLSDNTDNSMLNILPLIDNDSEELQSKSNSHKYVPIIDL